MNVGCKIILTRRLWRDKEREREKEGGREGRRGREIGRDREDRMKEVKDEGVSGLPADVRLTWWLNQDLSPPQYCISSPASRHTPQYH